MGTPAPETCAEGWIANLLRQPTQGTETASSQQETESGLSPTQVFSDSQGAPVTIKSGVLKSRLKRVDVKYHRSHDLQVQGIVDFEYVNAENLADLLIKALPVPAHQGLASLNWAMFEFIRSWMTKVFARGFPSVASLMPIWVQEIR